MQQPAGGSPQLKRALNLPLLTLYGLGATVGAGIYALLGEIAGVAGYGAPASFLLAAVVAGFTACSFAELVARFPRAAGAALYVKQGFGSAGLALVIGLLVVLSGVVSCAAMLNGFAGYLQEFAAVERTWALLSTGLVLGAIAAWGITESVAAAATITVVEVGGLLLVIATGADGLAALPDRWHEFVPGTETAPLSGVLFGVTLAFYAFIGFEDMVDVAEEAQHVSVNIPRAILLTLGITTLLYGILMVTALLNMRPETLQASSAPLAALYQTNTGRDPTLIGIIALFAIVNGALIQIIMASRVLYGLASRHQLPAVLGLVNARTRTPVVATALLTVLVLALALYGRLAGLAVATSLIMLSIFATVNLSLLRVKGREQAPPRHLTFPRAFPAVGFLLSAGLVLWELTDLLS